MLALQNQLAFGQFDLVVTEGGDNADCAAESDSASEATFKGVSNCHEENTKKIMPLRHAIESVVKPPQPDVVNPASHQEGNSQTCCPGDGHNPLKIPTWGAKNLICVSRSMNQIPRTGQNQV